MRTKGVFLLGLIVCWTAVCNSEDGSKYDIRIRDQLEKELAKEYLYLARAAAEPGDSCSEDSDCDDRQKCDGEKDAKTCQCATGVGGTNCENDELCEDDKKFKDCKGTNGSCEYSKEVRSVVCKCDGVKKLHPTENRCRDTCTDNNCKNGGTCEENFCTCKEGFFGDKCETIFDCTDNGKYRGCESSKGKCTHDGSETVCTCPANKKYHEKEHVCKDTCAEDNECENGETCNNNFCSCKEGFIGDKCLTIIDCTDKGKYKGCVDSGGKCTHDGSEAVCTCPENQKYHDTEHVCKATCSDNNGCKDNQTCKDISGWNTCICADGLSGKNCENMYWCDGKFKNCNGVNGTCEYVKDKRSVDCTCDEGKALSTTESRCRDTCSKNEDCKHGGTCNENFCSCKLGLFGDKCETIYDCTDKGKYRGCKKTGGECTHDGNNSVCKCPDKQIYHGTEHVCKECYCGSKGNCRFEKGEKKCDCQTGFEVKDGICTATCSKDTDCNEKQKCDLKADWKSCICADGLSGENCEKNDWCEEKFKNCKGVNGTCDYNKAKRTVECTCTSGKILHPTENRCRETCTDDKDCKYGGKCEADKFCSCKPGLFGDKCETIFDCTSEGEFKYCKSSGGTCSHDGNTAACKCPGTKKLHEKEGMCKDPCAKDDECKNGGTCEDNICTCKSGTTGDKCETVIDCEANGKYKNCKSTGGTCTYVDSNAVCTCPDNKKYHEKEHACKATCSDDNGCKGNQTCREINDWMTCVCAPGLSGANCEKKVWCEDKFKNCKGVNGTCDYNNEKRTVECTCTSGKALHPTENRCRDSCSNNDDCKNGATCENNFCSCKAGLFGDKCETVFDCESNGKYKGCASSGGVCTYDGNNAVCKCPESKRLHDIEHVCKDCDCGSEGSCKFDKGQKKCDCNSGFADKNGICTATCSKDTDCNEKQKCKEISGFKTCICADGLSGANCEKKDWCEGTGKFKNCKGINGTCDYNKENRTVECTCTSEKALHPTENRCRDTCSTNEDCKHGGTCKNKFCSCKAGLFGDKCETVFDCEANGKYKGCTNSGGTCSHDGSKGVCACPENKRLHETENICKEFCNNNEECNGGECKGPEGKKICSCKIGLKGDKCGTIHDCVDGKYSKCGTSGGECKFETNKAVCTCSGTKKLDTTENVCKEKCSDSKECKNGATCIANLCKCQTGTSGDRCETINDCGTLKCEDKSATCIFKNRKAACECNDKNYYFEDDQCKPEFCKNGCNKESTCDFINGVGVCKCKAEGTYYNYAAEKCQPIDKCFNITCGDGTVCKNGVCQCDDNHEKKEDGKCQPKDFCDKKNDPCFSGSSCVSSNPIGYVTCACNDTTFYNPKTKRCEDGSCFLTGQKTNCKKSCPGDMERKDGVCSHKSEKTVCGKECGALGWCYNYTAQLQKCVCETDVAELDQKTEKCVLKASSICPTVERDGEVKCKCTGKYKDAKNGITCELKSCSDEDVKNECKQKRAEKCVDNWKGDGYNCMCPNGHLKDKNGVCIDPCSMDSMRDTCLSTGKVCYIGTKDKVGDCRCLPTFTDNPTTKICEPNGKNTVMIHRLPVNSKKYEIAEKNINKVLLNSDVSNSMKQAFKNLDFVYLYSFKVQGDVLLCDVWLQFQLTGLPEKFNATSEARRWKSITEEANNQRFLPPALFLSSNFENATVDEVTLCSNSVRQSVCGRGSKCETNKCTCLAGFREIDTTLKTYGDKGRTVRCEDIDECAEGTHTCKDNSECMNTEGDYYCRCKPGYKKSEKDKNACIGLCEAKPCNNGDCTLTKENTIDCTCQAGYSGSFCNKKDERLAKAGQATKVVGAVLGTMLAIVIVLIIVYIVRQRKNSYSEDFTPPPRNDNAEMTERRPMRGVTNRAYQ